jgi:hypothetical protein
VLLLLRALEVLLPDEFVLVARGGCGAGGGELDGSAELATNAEKLSVYCNGSGRADFGAL